jgi:hypothetical protein
MGFRFSLGDGSMIKSLYQSFKVPAILLRRRAGNLKGISVFEKAYPTIPRNPFIRIFCDYITINVSCAFINIILNHLFCRDVDDA